MASQLDAKKLALYLGISLASLANAIDKGYKAVFKTPASESLQPALAPIHRTVAALDRYFDRREESLASLNTANPERGVSGRRISSGTDQTARSRKLVTSGQTRSA